MKSLKNLFFAGLAVLTITFAACKNDGGSPSPSVDDPLDTPVDLLDTLLDTLGDLDQAKVTGQPDISVTGAALGGDKVGNVTITGGNEADGYNLSVTGGKLTLNLTTPTNLGNESDQQGHFPGLKIMLLGSTDAAPEGTFNPSDAEFCFCSSFSGTGDGSTYYVYRYAAQTGAETYFVDITIHYVYVDKDCSIISAAKDISGTDDGVAWTDHYDKVDLSLKTGWNLIQVNRNGTEKGMTVTVKIADKDIPWEIYKN
ncbi:MAG: hypothetical protein LBP20_07485 [Treponema sp.]|jgi:hypothetical protein|nr:hypothetical protein [Treponema sp.]